MSVIGYPDYFRPRDYLAGLEGQQVSAAQSITAPSGSHTIYTVPAGKTLAIRYLLNLVSGTVAAGAGGVGTLKSVVQAVNGLDGGSATIILSFAELMLNPGGHGTDHDNVLVPLVIKGGAAGNPITTNQVVNGMANWDGLASLFGTLLN